MADEWQLPDLVSVVNTGWDWLLYLLASIPKDSISKVLRTLWRALHVRNEIVHDKQPSSLEVSKKFLLSYMESLLMIKYHSTEDISKGKFALCADMVSTREMQVTESPSWTPPHVGWDKLNTDGSFGPNGEAGAGIIVRDHNGEILLSSCRQLLQCKDPLGAELFSVREGLLLALHWCNNPLIIETDCLEIVGLLNNKEMDRSPYAMMIEEIKTLLKVRQACITHVKRCQNTCSHFLANYARTSSRTAMWFASGPEGLPSLCHRDCNI